MIKICFKKNMSGYYLVDERQTFTKEEVLFIQKAIKEAYVKEKEKKEDKP